MSHKEIESPLTLKIFAVTILLLGMYIRNNWTRVIPYTKILVVGETGKSQNIPQEGKRKIITRHDNVAIEKKNELGPFS